MAKEKDEAKEKRALARFVPHTVVNVGGHDIMVPNGPAENANANRLLASQARDMVATTIKRLKDGDVCPTPKELRDLIEAAKAVADMSATVYSATSDEPQKKQERQVEPAGDDINLDSIGEILKPK